ncbi:MAG: hypothetical protein K0S78_3768 [Thermomicrobiales bacterium]|jgi:uncharacterized protein (DUF1330 family)|nr:hypothetical protein [Thermomicrobiales bacterium]
MAAYSIAIAREVPEDSYELMRPYRERIEATMAPYGGFYRSYLRHRVEVVEGDWGHHHGLTIVEFPTFEQARAWYDSAAYAPLKALRQQHNRFDMLLADGLSDEEIAANLRQVNMSR